MSLKQKVDSVRKELKLREDETGKFRKLTIKERFWLWVNRSRFVLAVTMLLIGSSWTYDYIEGVKFFNEVIPNRDYAIHSLETYEQVKIKKDLLGSVVQAAENQATQNASEEVGDKSNSSQSSVAEFTAYNAEQGQTDADPFTMASGKKVYEGAVANNCLAFGTKIKVNGKIKVVEDRMNSRYGCESFDIYMNSHEAAVNFGRQNLEYVIIK